MLRCDESTSRCIGQCREFKKGSGTNSGHTLRARLALRRCHFLCEERDPGRHQFQQMAAEADPAEADAEEVDDEIRILLQTSQPFAPVFLP